MMSTAAHLAVAQLQSEGVDRLFSLNGGHIAPIYDACLDAGIHLIDVRHEDAAVHMAHAWSRLTDHIGVVVVSNNAAWGIEANSQRIDFGADREIGTLLRDCRFDLVARA